MPRPSSRQIFGSWVVLPEPVSPATITTWCLSIAAPISSLSLLTGSSSGYSILGTLSRRDAMRSSALSTSAAIRARTASRSRALRAPSSRRRSRCSSRGISSGRRARSAWKGDGSDILGPRIAARDGPGFRISPARDRAHAKGPSPAARGLHGRRASAGPTGLLRSRSRSHSLAPPDEHVGGDQPRADEREDDAEPGLSALDRFLTTDLHPDVREDQGPEPDENQK